VVYAVPMTLQRFADRIEPRAFTLAPPRPVEGTGGVIYTLALAVPGVFRYAFGDVYTPPETLQDPEHLAALAGVPVIDDDQATHIEGVDPDTMEGAAIGRVLRAWWDEPQQVLIAEAVIDVRRGLDAIARGVVGVSEGYSGQLVEEVGEIDGSRYDLRQVKRVAPSNVAITLNPRHAVTRLQADAKEAEMEIPAEILKKFADADVPLMELVTMLMEAIKEGAAAKATADALRAKYEPEGGAEAVAEVEAAADEASASVETPMADPDDAKVEGMADALKLADELGISVDGAWTLRQVKRAIVTCRGVPQAQADSLTGDTLAAAYAMARTLPMADAFDRLSARPAKTTATSTSTHGE
jgi:hypothetical protein